MLLGILSCREAVARLDDFIDRELSPREQILVARHLKFCRRCAQRFHFEAEIVAGLRQKLGHLQAPPELLDQIRASLPDESGTSGGSSRGH